MPLIASNGYYHVVNEVPTLVPNTGGLIFSTANKFKMNSLKVYLNGLLKVPFIDYCEKDGDKSFAMTNPPGGGTLIVEYDVMF
jgi:hypothetical protein